MSYETDRENEAIGPEVCPDCEHPLRLHGPEGCEMELGDSWDGGPCGCQATTLEPIEESELERARRTTGTFAEGQQRLARALDAITMACLMDGSDCGSNFCPPGKGQS